MHEGLTMYPSGGYTIVVTRGVQRQLLCRCSVVCCASPIMQEGVTVVGYPIGGDTMSVTSGVISRIEVTSYVHGAAELLGIQIDAAVSAWC